MINDGTELMTVMCTELSTCSCWVQQLRWPTEKWLEGDWVINGWWYLQGLCCWAHRWAAAFVWMTSSTQLVSGWAGGVGGAWWFPFGELGAVDGINWAVWGFCVDSETLLFWRFGHIWSNTWKTCRATADKDSDQKWLFRSLFRPKWMFCSYSEQDAAADKTRPAKKLHSAPPSPDRQTVAGLDSIRRKTSKLRWFCRWFCIFIPGLRHSSALLFPCFL